MTQIFICTVSSDSVTNQYYPELQSQQLLPVLEEQPVDQDHILAPSLQMTPFWLELSTEFTINLVKWLKTTHHFTEITIMVTLDKKNYTHQDTRVRTQNRITWSMILHRDWIKIRPLWKNTAAYKIMVSWNETMASWGWQQVTIKTLELKTMKTGITRDENEKKQE